MIPNIPTLALRFDIDKAGGGYYGFTCWKALWSAVDPGAIGGSSLYEGDTRATLDGRERVFLIALQNFDRGKLSNAERALAADASFMSIAASPAFAHDPEVRGEPLVDSGQVDGAGNLVGQGAAARSALGEIRRAQRAARQEGTPQPAVPARTAPASARTTGLPDIASLKDLANVLVTRLSPRDLYKYTDMFLTPQELCDVAERYESQLHIVYEEYGEDTLQVKLLWKDPRDGQCLQFTGLRSFPTPKEGVRAVREGWEISYQSDASIRPYVDALPKLVGLNGRFQANFAGMTNGCLVSDYDKMKQIAARDLWALFFRHATEAGIPIGTGEARGGRGEPSGGDRASGVEAPAPSQTGAVSGPNANLPAGIQVGRPAPGTTKGSRIWGGVFLVIGAVIVYTAVLVLATVIAGSQAGFKAKSDVFPILVFYGVLTAICLWAGIKRTRRWERFLGIAFLVLGALVLFARLNLSRVRPSEGVFTKAATVTGIVLLALGVTLFVLDLAKRRSAR